MVIQNKQIAIIGGGPGGLTLARLLQLQGAHVKVYERDVNRDVRVQGATLDLHTESGLEALRRAGLTDAFYANYRPEAGKLRLLDKNAVIRYEDLLAEGFDGHRPEIDRGPLRNILLSSLNDGTVVWDSNFASLTPYGDGWEIKFKNGSTATADLVIACDGANSKVRPYITDIKPIYSGITVVEGNLYHAQQNAPQLWQITNGGKVFAFGDDQSLILSAKGDGSLSFYTGCKVSENWSVDSGVDFADKQSVFAWFKNAFGTWDAVYQELFTTDKVWFVARPQYHYPLNQIWKPLPNLTMIGDAAHRMPPYAGEGVNMAMQDAFELAEHLTSDIYSNIEDAIGAFEKQMCKRAAEVTQMTLDSTEALHSGDPIKTMMEMFGENRE